MIRVEDPAVVFFHNPKAAGSSINRWFLSNIPGCRHVEPQHLLPRHITYTGWSFCVVRNPWDRWVSWWYYWNKKLNRIDTPFEEYTIKYFNQEYLGLPGGQYSPCGVQYDMASEVNCVLRYENLIEDFKVVQDKFSCYKPLPHLNVGHNRAKYTEYYTSHELIDIVANYAKKDIEEYGYSYD